MKNGSTTASSTEDKNAYIYPPRQTFKFKCMIIKAHSE
jgi:hypothetical protein